MNTGPARHPPGGAFHVAHTLTGNDATPLTLNVAEQWHDDLFLRYGLAGLGPGCRPAR
jgi:hypothetical protein